MTDIQMAKTAAKLLLNFNSAENTVKLEPSGGGVAVQVRGDSKATVHLRGVGLRSTHFMPTTEFYETISSAPDSGVLSIRDLEGGGVAFSCADWESKAATICGDKKVKFWGKHFAPVFDTDEGSFTMRTVDFMDAVQAVSYAACELWNPLLNAVRFEAKNDKVTVSASDGHRLASKVLPAHSCNSAEPMHIPANELRKLMPLLEYANKDVFSINSISPTDEIQLGKDSEGVIALRCDVLSICFKDRESDSEDSYPIFSFADLSEISRIKVYPQNLMRQLGSFLPVGGYAEDKQRVLFWFSGGGDILTVETAGVILPFYCKSVREAFKEFQKYDDDVMLTFSKLLGKRRSTYVMQVTYPKDTSYIALIGALNTERMG